MNLKNRPSKDQTMCQKRTKIKFVHILACLDKYYSSNTIDRELVSNENMAHVRMMLFWVIYYLNEKFNRSGDQWQLSLQVRY